MIFPGGIGKGHRGDFEVVVPLPLSAPFQSGAGNGGGAVQMIR